MLSNLFSNYVDVQLILELKNSFGKYHPGCPEKGFLGHAVYFFFITVDVFKLTTEITI